MARRTLAAVADLIEDRLDKSRDDVTFDNFVQAMLILTLQEIAAVVPWAKWLLDEASLTATVSGTQYIIMPSDIDLDSMISLTDRSNAQRKLIRISPEDADRIDPGRQLTGDEIVWWYQRVETGASTYEDRIYFLHQPDSVDTISAIFGVDVPQPTANVAAILPAKYEPIWIEGAMEKCYDRIDPTSSAKSMHRKMFLDGLEVIKRDANRMTSGSEVMASHRPKYGTGVQGPAFPANFDILP